MPSIKILAVEDDPIYAEALTLVVQELGYKLIGITDNGEEALTLAHSYCPDLILMDIQINGALSGVEVAARIKHELKIPVIYVTAFKDEQTFKQAKLTVPSAYIIKPYEPTSLQAAIELALLNKPYHGSHKNTLSGSIDSFFIKENNRLIKIKFDDILQVEVDEKYCWIITRQKKYIINMRLKDLLHQLPEGDFIQVHRSYVVRKSIIDEVNPAAQTLVAAGKTIPIGKTFKENLLASLYYLG